MEQGLFKGFIGTTMDVTEQELLTGVAQGVKPTLRKPKVSPTLAVADQLYTKQMFPPTCQRNLPSARVRSV